VKASRWISAVALVFAIVAGTGFWLQHETSAALRGEIALLRDEQKTLARLRAENERLSAAQVTDAELARLRADRAALMRLRDEIERMKARAEQTASAQQVASAATKAEAAPTPALVLNIALAPNGNLLRDGAPVDFNFEIRQQLAGLRRGDFVKIRCKIPDRSQFDLLNQRMDAFMALAKELGLRMEIIHERGGI
jgi:hypothetical protein